MLTILLATLFVMTASAALVSLTDSAIKWRNAFRALRSELAATANTRLPETECAVVTLHPAAGVSRRSVPAPLAIAA